MEESDWNCIRLGREEPSEVNVEGGPVVILDLTFEVWQSVDTILLFAPLRR